MAPTARARRTIRLVLIVLELAGTAALLGFGLAYLLPRAGPAAWPIWFWLAWIVVIALINLVTLVRDPDYPFSLLRRLRERRRR